MNQKNDCLNPAEIMISVEEFDTLESVHEFSADYRLKKERMLKNYCKKLRHQKYGKAWKLGQCAAAAVLLAFTAGVVNVAAGNELLYRIWGTHGKENITSHAEVLYDAKKDTSSTVIYPEREYTDQNLDEAEELIGGSLSFEPLIKEIGDTRLTILSAVSDGRAAVTAFTLEREGGVTALRYSQLANESKGAWFDENAPFYFCFEDCAENIFVDLEKSTDSMLYCYDYMVMQQTDAQAADSLTMMLYERLSDEEENQESLQVPLSTRTEQTAYSSAQGGGIDISPISMTIDMEMLPGISKEEARDPWHAYYVSVNYKDGSRYLVHEHGIEGLHSCEKDVDNVSYTLENTENQLIFVFNRLIDPKQVESVTVNETIYTPQHAMPD